MKMAWKPDFDYLLCLQAIFIYMQCFKCIIKHVNCNPDLCSGRIEEVAKVNIIL